MERGSDLADVPGLHRSEEFTHAELQLAARNHGIPLEALRYDVTPVGLHYLLTHYDMPVVDPVSWRLELGGEVERPLALSLDDLRAREAVTLQVTIECAGNGRAQMQPRGLSQPWLVEAVGSSEWTGAPLRSVLEEAGVGERAVEILFTALDRGIESGVEQTYERSLPLEDALMPEVLLAYEMNGQPLPPQHGYPVRVVVPGWYGMAHVKWLDRITALTEPFHGHQQDHAYRVRRHPDEEGEPVTRMRPRSLMVPPGFPDFLSRERFIEAEPCVLEGRAWSGFGRIWRVEVSTDGGETWADTDLGEQPSEWAWRRWSYEWKSPQPGAHELCSRATDDAGNGQPLEVLWNLKGYENNSVQRVPVTVRG